MSRKRSGSPSGGQDNLSSNQPERPQDDPFLAPPRSLPDRVMLRLRSGLAEYGTKIRLFRRNARLYPRTISASFITCVCHFETERFNPSPVT